MYNMKITIIPKVSFTGNVKNFGEIDDETGNKGKKDL